MCGIVGAVAQRDVAEILINGLHRLEYRGYDFRYITLRYRADNTTHKPSLLLIK